MIVMCVFCLYRLRYRKVEMWKWLIIEILVVYQLVVVVWNVIRLMSLVVLGSNSVGRSMS